MDERNERILKCLGLVVWLAKQFRGRGLDLGDLIGEGNLALVRASAKYDESRGTFATFARTVIANALKLAILKCHGFKTSYSSKRMNPPKYEQLKDVIDQRHKEDRAGSEWLGKRLEDMPERLAAILKLRYGLQGEPKTCRETGEVVGLSYGRVQQLESAALRVLREAS